MLHRPNGSPFLNTRLTNSSCRASWPSRRSIFHSFNNSSKKAASAASFPSLPEASSPNVSLRWGKHERKEYVYPNQREASGFKLIIKRFTSPPSIWLQIYSDRARLDQSLWIKVVTCSIFWNSDYAICWLSVQYYSPCRHTLSLRESISTPDLDK